MFKHRLHVWSPLLLHISIHDEWVPRRSVKSLFRAHITAVWCRQRWRLFVWRPPASRRSAVLSYCTSAQHLSSSSTESWWLLSSHLFLPHYLFTKHKAGQGAVHSFTGTVFICLKLVNTVKCTEPPLCSAAVLQCSVIIRCRDADTLQLNNFTVQLHLEWFI